MSIWGPAVTQNDDATDWLSELRDEPQLRAVQSAIRGALRKGYLDVDRCTEAIAAAQVLAEACGVGGKTSIVSKSIMLLIRRELQALTKPKLKALCKDAATAVVTARDDAKRSELHQLWSEDKKRAVWRTNLNDLEKRLAGGAVSLAKLPAVPSPKRKPKQPANPNLGKVFAIPLPNRRYAYAKGFRNGVVAVYDMITTKPRSLDEVIGSPVAMHACVIDAAPRRGKWKLLGEDPFASDDEAWGPPMAAGLTNEAIATHLWVFERGVERTVPYDQAVGMEIWGAGNERTIVWDIVRLVVEKEAPGRDDVVLAKSDPRVD